MGPLRYKAYQAYQAYQAYLDIGIHAVDNFNKVLAEMPKYSFPAYAFCEQKR